MKIGLRTIKTGIAISLSMLVVGLLDTDPFFTMVAALIAIQPTISDSWRIGVNRMLGTFIGALVGLIFVSFTPQNFIFAGIGIILLIYIMNQLRWNESINIAGVVFIAVFVNISTNHLGYAFNRLIDTFIGIGIAVLINYLIYPPTYDVKATEEIKKASRDIWKYYIVALGILLRQKPESMDISDKEIEMMDQEIKESEKFIKLQLKEDKLWVYGKRNSKEIVIIIKLIKENFQHFLNLYSVLKKDIAPEVTDLIKADLILILERMKRYSEDEVEILQNEKPIDLTPVMEIIQKIKNRLKFSEDINQYPTDEVVKMMVILYNLEEALSKFNIIKSF
ncbi:FUSC family protein [Alkaliphilus hydrothermalis]|uniref:Uncharacterized membrane protein YgaE (UPF0421/DUF939 family) n=1 Tax=Alkaliphilus hydrothermalis TaxID=1482730 RepID=A0ABS2NRI1_9FIRM|nr:aromatic acid exporter family protein [Alkaliphilus hydrothermalis]MBM7615562.1 uncharacterized membrane protein YgaE (UPF0421/DUF939 family) [Alkaliphilus hydrothermalis]